MVISTLGWVLVGAAAWLAVAALVGVLIGRMIRHRDARTTATDERPGRVADHPGDPAHPHGAVGEGHRGPGVPGRGRQRRR